MNVLSVCSGVGTDALAFGPLGWKHVAFAEIDPFPSAVLRHRWPLIPNLGDFTTITNDKIGNERIDVLVGGTPCQDFSVAGKRAGLEGERGNLSLEFIRLAYRLNPRYVIWENVPGVLSSNKGRDFGAFLGELCGLGVDIPVPPKGWKNTGHVVGRDSSSYHATWRVLDAQYFGLPQRRRRVFLVAYLGEGRGREVLLERTCLSWDPPPSREEGEGVAPTISARVKGGGGLGTDFDCDGGLVVGDNVARCVTSGEGKRQWPATVTSTLNAHYGDKWGLEDQHALNGAELFVPVAFSAKDHGADALAGCASTLRAGGYDRTHANSGNWTAIAWDEEMNARIEQSPSVLRGGDGGRHAGVMSKMKVRRLTPIECERLQGLPDNHTFVPWRRTLSPDGPRYKAIGNGMARPVLQWVGERISEVEGRLGR